MKQNGLDVLSGGGVKNIQWIIRGVDLENVFSRADVLEVIHSVRAGDGGGRGLILIAAVGIGREESDSRARHWEGGSSIPVHAFHPATQIGRSGQECD